MLTYSAVSSNWSSASQAAASSSTYWSLGLGAAAICSYSTFWNSEKTDVVAGPASPAAASSGKHIILTDDQKRAIVAAASSSASWPSIFCYLDTASNNIASLPVLNLFLI
jgi:hypothetical protein